MKLKDALEGRGLRLIQYGESGVGKTVRASEAARWGKVEYHDFDDQTQNLAAYLMAKHPDRVDRIEIISYAGLTDAEKWAKFDKRLTELADSETDVKTLVIDSYTRFEHIYFNFLASVYNPPTGGYGTPRKNIKTGKDDTLVLPGTNDYAILAAAVKKLTGRLKDLKINIIVNAHVREPSPGNKGEAGKPGCLAASGQIRAFLPTEFTEYHRLYVDNYGKRRVQAQTAMGYSAKTALTDVPQNGVLKTNSLEVFDDRAVKSTEKE